MMWVVCWQNKDGAACIEIISRDGFLEKIYFKKSEGPQMRAFAF